MTLVSSEGGFFQIGPVTLSFARCPKPIYTNSAYETTAPEKAWSSPWGMLAHSFPPPRRELRKQQRVLRPSVPQFNLLIYSVLSATLP